jgi:hypothetical protein
VLVRPHAAAREHLPEDHAGRVDVGAPVDGLAARLLGRHVRELAAQDPRARQVQRAGGLGDAEVDEFDRALVGDEDVVRADVAVHDPERPPVVVAQLVRVVQPRQHVGNRAQEDRQRRPAVGPRLDAHRPAQRLALEVLHHEVVRALLFADLVGLHHVRVVQPRRDARLVEEQLDVLGLGRDLALDDLDDRQLSKTDEPARDAQVHVGHAPAAEACNDAVTPDLCRMRGR